MRRILVASLFMSTVLLNAQTATKGQGATLVAHNETSTESAASAAGSPGTDVTSTTHARRISTGVIAPKLISEPELRLATTDFPTADLATEHMEVSFKVDANGTPQNVHLVKSAGQVVDQRVLEAVRQYRFAPATLDDQAVAMDVNLIINFQSR
jgi:TonB family protein